MPDIVSKIRLEASGGDQVAREIRKIQQASQDASRSLGGMSSAEGGSSAGPSGSAAYRPAGLSDVERQQRDQASKLHDEHRVIQQEARDREVGYRGTLGRIRGVSEIGQGVGALSAGGAGGMNALGGLLSSAGSLLMGPVGIAAAVATAAVKIVGAIGAPEMERFKSLYYSGVSQRLTGGAPIQGVNGYEFARNMQLNMIAAGIPPEMIGALMSSMSQTGVNLGRAGMVGTAHAGRLYESAIGMGSEAMSEWGLNPNVLATFLGVGSRTGAIRAPIVGRTASGSPLYGNVNGAFGSPFYQKLAGTFSPENAGMAMSSITQMMQGMASQGVNLGTPGVTSGLEDNLFRLRMISSSPDAAIAAYQSEWGGSMNASNLAKPLDIVAFSLFSQYAQKNLPGVKGYSAIRAAMAQNPTVVQHLMYEHIKSNYRADIAPSIWQQWTGQTNAYQANISYQSQADTPTTTADVHGYGVNSSTLGSLSPQREWTAALNAPMLTGVQSTALGLSRLILGDLKGVSSTNLNANRAVGGGLGFSMEAEKTPQQQATDAAIKTAEGVDTSNKHLETISKNIANMNKIMTETAPSGDWQSKVQLQHDPTGSRK